MLIDFYDPIFDNCMSRSDLQFKNLAYRVAALCGSRAALLFSLLVQEQLEFKCHNYEFNYSTYMR